MLNFKWFAVYQVFHIESCGKNNATRLIKLQSISFFLVGHIEHIYFVFIPVSFQKLFKILQNGAQITTALFWLTLYNVDLLHGGRSAPRSAHELTCF